MAPGILDSKGFRAPPVTGSLSEKAHRKGFVHCENTFQASICAGTEGSFGSMGTRLGMARIPALQDGSGKGAS